MFVAMIWRPQPGRERAYAISSEFWSLLGDVKHFDSGHQPFNRAASRNAAVTWAQQHQYQKLVITDADTIVERDPLLEAWAQADNSAVHLPYDRCRVFNRDDTVAGEFTFTCGGVYITTPTAWWAAGGQDERFDKWAPEDMAFKFAHETLVGPIVRHQGFLASLSHPPDPHRPADDATDPLVTLYRRYEAANGHPEQMRALIKGN